nr:lamin tail domain-containing protein [Calditrichia bacterium]
MKWIATMLLVLMASAFAQQSGEVVITEILYNPASDEGTVLTQAMEIVNLTNAPINLNNWTIDDEDGDGPNTLPNVTLPAFGVAVICGGSSVDYTAAFGSTAGYLLISLDDLAQTMFNMSNSPSAVSEIIQLRDENGDLVDEVNYDDATPWPSDAPQTSVYLALPNGSINATSNDDGSNWANAADGVDGGYLSTGGATWNAVETTSLGTVNGDNSLPVSLSAFSATAGDQRVTLRWTTQSEINNVGFEILRSTSENGTYSLYDSYQNNSALRGQFNTQDQTNYNFVDNFVANDFTYFYKLVDVDVNGTRTEHGPVSATPSISAVDITTISSNIPTAF